MYNDSWNKAGRALEKWNAMTNIKKLLEKTRNDIEAMPEIETNHFFPTVPSVSDMLRGFYEMVMDIITIFVRHDRPTERTNYAVEYGRLQEKYQRIQRGALTSEQKREFLCKANTCISQIEGYIKNYQTKYYDNATYTRRAYDSCSIL